MKKKQYILGMCFILLAIMTGCGDSSIKQRNEILKGAEILQEVEAVNKEESLYNTAFEKYAEDEVIALIINDPAQEVVEEETLYAKSYTGNDYGLLVETFRPEGIPEVLVSICIGNRQATYVIAEDGKDGIPSLMYLRAKGYNE